jgi:hypothetical protein
LSSAPDAEHVCIEIPPMSEEPTLDLETLRQPRIERLEADLHELAGRMTHLHWPSTDAEVTECRLARSRRSWDCYRYGPPPTLQLEYIVSFSYSVQGKAYSGTLNSPVEVERGDHFALRINPDHPDENNSVCSDNSPSSIISPVIAIVLAVLILLLFLKDRFFKH